MESNYENEQELEDLEEEDYDPDESVVEAYDRARDEELTLKDDPLWEKSQK